MGRCISVLILFRNGNVQQPEHILLCLYDTLCSKGKETFVILMRPFQKADIFAPQNRGNHSHHISGLYQCRIHQQPGYAPVYETVLSQIGDATMDAPEGY